MSVIFQGFSHHDSAIREALRISRNIHKSDPHEITLKGTFVPIYVLFHHFSILGLIIMATFICEKHPPFRSVERQDFDEDSFVFTIILVITIGCFTWKENGSFMKDKYGDLNNYEQDDNLSETTSLGASSYGTSVGASSFGGSSFGGSTMSASVENINIQKKSMTSKGRVASGNTSINSTDLESLLEKDKSVASLDKDDASSLVASSVNSEDTLKTGQESDGGSDHLLEDILTSDNDDRDMESRELMDHEMMGVPTFAEEPDKDVLNLHQTLELKGALTLCYLVYQSANAGRAFESQHHNIGYSPDLGDVYNPYYNLSKVGTSAFLFLTGYGHTCYFLQREDYSFRRLLKILLRINLSALFLCLALDKSYIFYKACAVHTYFVFLVYVTICWRKSKNHTKFGLRIKMMIAALFVFLLWDCPLRLWPVHAIIFGRSQSSISGAQYGRLWEFYFQGHLHHWAPLIGMLFAVNKDVTSLTLRRLEKLGISIELLFKGIIGTTITFAFGLWYLGPFHAKKFMYNAINSYFGFLPILWYVFFRNSTVALRSSHSKLFKAIGMYSLELYMLHQHIFLSDESGSKLMVIPGYPACNILVITALLFSVARYLKTVTSVLISLLLSSSADKYAIWNSCALIGCLSFLYTIASLFDMFGINNPHVVATSTLICGLLLHQAIVDITSSSAKKGSSNKYSSRNSSIIDDSVTSKGIPTLIAAFGIAILCILWHLASVSGVASHSLPLPKACGEVANQGKWTIVPACSEFQKGINSRDFGSRTHSKTCEDIHQWGWVKNKYSSKCRFKFHEPIDAQTKLEGRNIMFLGDTVTRSVYFAFCRALGDQSAGNFDAELPLHSEITKSFGETKISFQWAPLTNDVLEKLKAIKPETDLVIAGSGALDKLHLWATEADRQSYENTVKQVAKDLQFLKDQSAPVVWIKPTAVNTKALPNEEKRTQMSETKIQEIREMQGKHGIYEAATFVLDAFSLTESQVERSFDGIHYPTQIYDVCAQIVMNTIDWLIPPSGKYYTPTSSFKPKPGSMANPALGLMVLCCFMIGLFFFDGYIGFSYLATALMQPTASPLPNKITLFYMSRDEQTKYSFVPQDVFQEVHRAHQSRRSKQRQDKIPKSDLPKKSRDRDQEDAGSILSSLSGGKSKYTVSSRRTFGLETINED